MRLLTTIALLSTMLTLVGCGAINEELPPYEATSIINVDDQAPDFTATTLCGEQFTLSEHSDEVVLLILFSHTCPDCKALLDDITARQADITARLIAISRDGSCEEVAQYMDDNGYHFDVIIDNNREIYNLYATMYVPRTYLIDQDGVVRHTTIEYAETHVQNIIEWIKTLR